MKKQKMFNFILNLIIFTILLISISYLYKAFTYKGLDYTGINKYMSNIIYLTISLVFVILSVAVLIYKQIKNIKVKINYRKTR